MRGILFAALAAFLSSVSVQGQTAIGQSPVAIDESKILATLEGGSTNIVVPITNTLNREVRAQLVLEWIDTDDRSLASARNDLSILPGGTRVELPLALPKPSLWLRLRYSLIPSREHALDFAPFSGIVGLTEIAQHVFELKATQVGAPRPGKPFIVHAQAVHPVTRKPVYGVKWFARLKFGGIDVAPSRISAQTEGLVDIEFDVPSDEGENDGDQSEVRVQGKLGDFSNEVVADIPIPSHLSARLQTDKPIYQPGQTLHLRAVISDPEGRAFDSAKVVLQIDSEDDDRLHTAHLTASRFGIVHDDWTLPASADLGAYQIKLTTEEDEDYALARHIVRVSRYELPEFNVTAKPDRAAYLADQKTKVSVTGTYLFGKPVPRGQVKVTRSGEQRWNAKTRKYETNTETVAEGQAGEDGTFVAALDLEADHEQLQKSDYERFQDVHFVAYYTDPSSGRTEQRRFDVRITREPVHVYFMPTDLGGTLPIPVYISTDYADGSPASANVEIRYHRQIVTLRTNRYGIGKAFLAGDNDSDRDGEITVRAADNSGQTGTWVERYWHPGLESFRLETGRTLYRAGESVALRISAPPQSTDDFVVVNAVADEQSVASRVVRLVNGKAELTFPYQPEFRRTVVFTAWNAASEHYTVHYGILAAKAVIFPDASDLKLAVATERPVYKPGEKASLRMQVSSSDGHPVEAALGLAIVDQAVLERARTDAEFGQRPWFACAFCQDGGEEQIGGVRLNDLYTLKPSSSISPELDLVAEALVARERAFVWSEEGESLQAEAKFKTVADRVLQISSALDNHYAATLEFPKNISDVARILGKAWTDLRDPWGMSYQASFTIEREENVFMLTSPGPDKRMGTTDDFVAGTFRKSYFAPLQALISQILQSSEDYPASSEELQDLLNANGLRLNSLSDAWGTPYRARVETHGSNRSITIWSAGPDRKLGTPDDFVAATFNGSYFQREKAEIGRALGAAPRSPQTIQEFQAVLKTAGIDLSKYRDAWGRPYRLRNVISSRYSDRFNSSTVQVFGGLATQRTEVVPVTQRLMTFVIRSDGPDGQEGTYDDFDIARFVTILAEESSGDARETKTQSANMLHGTGAITGIITDPTGAVIANATVVLIDATNIFYEAISGADGVYEFTFVPSGSYALRASSPGFNQYDVSQVPVTSDRTTKLDIRLNVGAVSESVTVEASAVVLQTEAAEVAARSLSTPRVREYFPETLLWLPEVVTDSQGRSRTQLTLADSVTTWKIAAIASTVDGRFAETDSEFRSFQPFFLDFNPPQVLTEGDRIDLPVAVRNYLVRDQNVSVDIQPNEWSTLSGTATRQVSVPSNSSANVSYTIQAKRAIDSAAERVIGTAAHNWDAIEKRIRVHPDGQEVTQTVGDLVVGETAFSVSFPPTAIAHATRAELRIYPNIASMLLESASGILGSPHGCAEQTISAGYANLTALQYARSIGIQDLELEKTALANINQARDSLAGFEASDGGIAYWPKQQSDIAITAYALNFLSDASGIVAVDRDDVKALIGWLQRKQNSDGTWTLQTSSPDVANRQMLLLTALVLRALAAAQRSGVPVQPAVFVGAYHHLAAFTSRYGEPYALALFILSALDSGDEQLLADAPSRLASLAREEKGALYWDLRTNSPFYGWGTAGRLETTGLVISALSAWYSKHPRDHAVEPVIRRGLVFLLRGRDHSGSWFSTQATVRAMRAIVDAAAVVGNLGGGGGRFEVRANGNPVKVVTLPDDPHAIDPIILDMSGFLKTGENRIEINPSHGAQSALLRFTSTHWLTWSKTEPHQSSELKLAVTFDHLESRAGEPVHCSVKAERVGFRGYGMMIAEIGLPPGAGVDRASLESVLGDDSLGVDRYDVLPDRILFYLWPKAGGASFDFVMRARIPMVAKSSASVLYDYYNPEAVSEVSPFQWRINEVTAR